MDIEGMDMKYLYIIGLLVLTITVQAQNETPADTLPGMTGSFVNTGVGNSHYGMCTLVKNHYTDRRIKNYKNGYKIVTTGRHEVIKVRNGKDGTVKIRYVNDEEGLHYKKNKGGVETFRYMYFEDCRKIVMRKNRKGILTMNHKSSLNWREIDERVYSAIERGVNTCSAQGRHKKQ